MRFAERGMRRFWTTAYAVFCTTALCASCLLVFLFAWKGGIHTAVRCVCGLAYGVIAAPIVHEAGHVLFGLWADMKCVYVKCFCFKYSMKNGKMRFCFASPFSADQTQMLPKSGGNMQKRAMRYTLGGEIFSGVFFLLLLVTTILCTAFFAPPYKVWGMLPYVGYLFFLNLPPLCYASGKTDVLVALGLKKDYAAERTMLSAMEIQGGLYEGRAFAEIDEKFYFDLPQLPEDEPLFAVMLDLRYRYFLEKNDYDKAAESLNRLAQAQPYLSSDETQRLAAELVYMHSIGGDIERAEASAKLCTEYLKENTMTAKRVLAAYAKATGNAEGTTVLLRQAREASSKELLLGQRKSEEILLARLEE